MHCHFKDYFHISNFVLVLFLNEISILSSRKVIKGNSNGKDSLIYIKRFSTLQLSFKVINKIVFQPGHINYTCLRNCSILNCYPLYPSILQTTLASSLSQWSSQTVPSVFPSVTTTRPSLEVDPPTKCTETISIVNIKKKTTIFHINHI